MSNERILTDPTDLFSSFNFSLISRMLQRAPECRASLDDIAYDPWLGGGGDAQASNYAIPMDEQLPLVAREHLSEEDHANILKRMVVGKIASQVNKFKYNI